MNWKKIHENFSHYFWAFFQATIFFNNSTKIETNWNIYTGIMIISVHILSPILRGIHKHYQNNYSIYGKNNISKFYANDLLKHEIMSIRKCSFKNLRITLIIYWLSTKFHIIECDKVQAIAYNGKTHANGV